MRLSAHRRRLALYAAAVPLLIGGPVAGNGLLADQWWQASVSNALKSVRPGADEPTAAPENPQDLEDLLKGAHPADRSTAEVPPAGGDGVDVSDTGLPARVLAAYRNAAATMAREDPGCHLDWPLLAGIGKVESGHARGGAVDANGLTLTPILGPQLSGGPDIAAIRDTDDGRWDDDATWDRAVGPMQFIPTSWASHGADGNGDGVRDPNNVADAALASAGYLCTGDRNVSVEEDRRAAVFSYNHSWDYVDLVLQWADAYANGTAALTDDLPDVVGVRHGGSGASTDVSRPVSRPGTGGGSPDSDADPTPSPETPGTPGTRPGSRPSPTPTPTSGASTSPGSGSGTGAPSTGSGSGSGSGSTDAGSSGSGSGSGSGSTTSGSCSGSTV